MNKPINQKHLGEFEILVIAALLQLGSNAYGVTIRQEIERRANRSVSIGAIYTTLSRMEKKSYVSSTTGLATKERGGKAKRFFAVTSAGKEQFNRSLEAIQSMTDGIDDLSGA